MKKFLSTPSARRATFEVYTFDAGRKFLSTPSARRATEALEQQLEENKISIHALREEGDLHTGHHAGCAIDISIHALREEGDLAGFVDLSGYVEFLSTPSARRATFSSAEE